MWWSSAYLHVKCSDISVCVCVCKIRNSNQPFYAHYAVSRCAHIHYKATRRLRRRKRRAVENYDPSLSQGIVHTSLLSECCIFVCVCICTYVDCVWVCADVGSIFKCSNCTWMLSMIFIYGAGSKSAHSSCSWYFPTKRGRWLGVGVRFTCDKCLIAAFTIPVRLERIRAI